MIACLTRSGLSSPVVVCGWIWKLYQAGFQRTTIGDILISVERGAGAQSMTPSE